MGGHTVDVNAAGINKLYEGTSYEVPNYTVIYSED